jgi:hypothetical protein
VAPLNQNLITDVRGKCRHSHLVGHRNLHRDNLLLPDVHPSTSQKMFPSLFPPAQNQFVTRNNFNTRNNFAAQNSNWTNSNFDSQASNATLASPGLTHPRGAKTSDKFRSSNSRFQSASLGLGKESWDAGNGIGNSEIARRVDFLHSLLQPRY